MNLHNLLNQMIRKDYLFIHLLIGFQEKMLYYTNLSSLLSFTSDEWILLDLQWNSN